MAIDVKIHDDKNTVDWPDATLTISRILMQVVDEKMGVQLAKIVVTDGKSEWTVALDSDTLRKAMSTAFDYQKVDPVLMDAIRAYFEERFNWKISA